MNEMKTPYSGEWVGYFRDERATPPHDQGWMQMYLEINEGQIRGEGTDYVGPWKIAGVMDVAEGSVSWTKTYFGQHDVSYRGKLVEDSIRGIWKIDEDCGEFHVWPKYLAHLYESYLPNLK